MHAAWHSWMMGIRIRNLTPEELASVLKVGNTCAAREPPPIVMPAEHGARFIELGCIADLFGRLRMTTLGRSRIAAEFKSSAMPISLTRLRARQAGIFIDLFAGALTASARTASGTA
jgi:hypothetical protein